ncbi:MAG: hypothetical protein C0475_04685 [Planctomyces sp.]|nr:hypothetical protein [Planctomyces sp.]
MGAAGAVGWPRAPAEAISSVTMPTRAVAQTRRGFNGPGIGVTPSRWAPGPGAARQRLGGAPSSSESPRGAARGWFDRSGRRPQALTTLGASERVRGRELVGHRANPCPVRGAPPGCHSVPGWAGPGHARVALLPAGWAA